MVRPFRILMISPQFRPLVGGYERAAERLSAELGRRGHAITIITERRDPEWAGREAIQALTVRRLWCIYRPGLHIITSLLSFSRFLLRNGLKYDVFHVHQYGAHAAMAVLFGRLLGRPVVLKITSTGSLSIENTIAGYRRLRRYAFTFLHRRVDACIAISADAAREAAEFGIPQERIVLVPNGIDTDYFRPCSEQQKAAAKKALGINHRHMVLYCGRLCEPKNPDGLLDAWASVVREFQDVLLCYVGDGALRTTLTEKTDRLGLQDTVRFVGQKSEVRKWYHAADVFALPSHNEGLSNSLLEAIGCGLPIVATRISGTIDLFRLGEPGLLVDDTDVKKLSDALIKILGDCSCRRAFGISASEIAAKHYSIGGVAGSMERLYSSLIRKDASHRRSPYSLTTEIDPSD